MKFSTLYKDSFFTLLGNGIGKALAFVSGIIIARFLGSDVFGQYSIVRNNLFMLAVFSTFGLGYTATKFISQCNDSLRMRSIVTSINVVSFLSSFLMALAVFLFSGKIAVWLNIPDLSYLMRFMAVLIVFNAITTTQIGILSGFKAFKTLAINNIASGAVTLVLSCILSLKWNLRGAMWALLISQVFNCAINFISEYKIKKSYPHSSDHGRGQYADIISFSIPVALQESLYSVSGWLIIFLLTNYSSYTQVGYYSAVTQWINMVMFVPAALRGVILSYVSSSSGEDEKLLVKRIRLVTFISSAFPAIIIASAAGYIVKFYGVGFEEMKLPLVVGIASTLFNSIAGVYNQQYIADGRNWTVFAISVVRETIFLAISYFALSRLNGLNDGALYVLSGFTLSIAVSLLLYKLSQTRTSV